MITLVTKSAVWFLCSIWIICSTL